MAHDLSCSLNKLLFPMSQSQATQHIVEENMSTIATPRSRWVIDAEQNNDIMIILPFSFGCCVGLTFYLITTKSSCQL